MSQNDYLYIATSRNITPVGAEGAERRPFLGGIMTSRHKIVGRSAKSQNNRIFRKPVARENCKEFKDITPKFQLQSWHLQHCKMSQKNSDFQKYAITFCDFVKF